MRYIHLDTCRFTTHAGVSVIVQQGRYIPRLQVMRSDNSTFELYQPWRVAAVLGENKRSKVSMVENVNLGTLPDYGTVSADSLPISSICCGQLRRLQTSRSASEHIAMTLRIPARPISPTHQRSSTKIMSISQCAYTASAGGDPPTNMSTNPLGISAGQVQMVGSRFWNCPKQICSVI